MICCTNFRTLLRKLEWFYDYFSTDRLKIELLMYLYITNLKNFNAILTDVSALWLTSKLSCKFLTWMLHVKAAYRPLTFCEFFNNSIHSSYIQKDFDILINFCAVTRCTQTRLSVLRIDEMILPVKVSNEVKKNFESLLRSLIKTPLMKLKIIRRIFQSETLYDNHNQALNHK